MQNNLIAISIFSLAISIVISSWLVTMDNKDVYPSQTVQEENDVKEEEKKLLTQKELASYLGLSVEESKKLGPVGGTHTSTSVLPNIKIGDKVYYSKDAIDKWLVENGTAHLNN